MQPCQAMCRPSPCSRGVVLAWVGQRTESKREAWSWLRGDAGCGEVSTCAWREEKRRRRSKYHGLPSIARHPAIHPLQLATAFIKKYA